MTNKSEKGKKKRRGAPRARKRFTFTIEEDVKIIRYLMGQQGQITPDKQLWEDMCRNITAETSLPKTPSRTWDVLKKRFKLIIKPHITKYESSIEKKELKDLMARLENSDDSEESNNSDSASDEELNGTDHNKTTTRKESTLGVNLLPSTPRSSKVKSEIEVIDIDLSPPSNQKSAQRHFRRIKNVEPDSETDEDEPNPVNSSGLNKKRKLGDGRENPSPHISPQTKVIRTSATQLNSQKKQDLPVPDNEAHSALRQGNCNPPVSKIKMEGVEAGGTRLVRKIPPPKLISSSAKAVGHVQEDSTHEVPKIMNAEQDASDRGMRCADKVLSQLIASDGIGLSLALATCEYLKNSKKLMDRILLEDRKKEGKAIMMGNQLRM